MRKNTVTALALSMMMGLSASAQLHAADSTLEDRVEARLKARKLGHLDVDVEGTTVVLKGEVGTARERTQAERLAKLKGVTAVENKIEIDADKAKARIEERADAAKDKVDERAKAAKDGIERRSEIAKDRAERAGDRPAGTPVVVDHDNKKRDNDVADPLITAKVKTKFAADDLVKAHTINIDSTNDGVVTLRGTVPSKAAHARALQIAKDTDGVRKVDDRLTVANDTK